MHVDCDTLDVVLRLDQAKFNAKCPGKVFYVSLGARMYRQKWCWKLGCESRDIDDECRSLVEQMM